MSLCSKTVKPSKHTTVQGGETLFQILIWVWIVSKTEGFCVAAITQCIGMEPVFLFLEINPVFISRSVPWKRNYYCHLLNVYQGATPQKWCILSIWRSNQPWNEVIACEVVLSVEGLVHQIRPCTDNAKNPPGSQACMKEVISINWIMWVRLNFKI